ncbi:MAG: resolvase, partial [Acetobacteraceae bacterium]|nr:resolvase [Acetobacteraceae bacterium]
MKADQRARNRYLRGRVPYGWRVTEAGELAEVPEQQAAIREVKRLRQEGASPRKIAEAMRAAGHKLSHEAVAGVLNG